MKDKLSVCCGTLIIEHYCTECGEFAKTIEKEELDMSDAPDLVKDDNYEYERNRYESQTEDRNSNWLGNY